MHASTHMCAPKLDSVVVVHFITFFFISVFCATHLTGFNFFPSSVYIYASITTMYVIVDIIVECVHIEFKRKEKNPHLRCDQNQDLFHVRKRFRVINNRFIFNASVAFNCHQIEVQRKQNN